MKERKFTIPVDANFLSAIGRAAYNFNYLEWGVIYGIMRLRACHVWEVGCIHRTSHVYGALTQAIVRTTIPLPAELRLRLTDFSERWKAAVEDRNSLLHSYPMTAENRLPASGGRGFRIWQETEILDAAMNFQILSDRAGSELRDELIKLGAKPF